LFAFILIPADAASAAISAFIFLEDLKIGALARNLGS
jgi:hypothetical protein